MGLGDEIISLSALMLGMKILGGERWLRVWMIEWKILKFLTMVRENG